MDSEKIINELSKVSKTFKRNVSLKAYTTFKIGGPARFFIEANSTEKLIECVI